jgi:sulfatase maturation enzyme AslB (radical SAM superfamily)
MEKLHGRMKEKYLVRTLRSVFVNSPPPKPEVILTNFFAEPTVLLVPITSRVVYWEKEYFLIF